MFLIALDGRVPDEGACFELGLAYGHRLATGCDRLIVGLHTDSRTAFPDAKLNAMLLGALDAIVEDRAALLEALRARCGERSRHSGIQVLPSSPGEGGATTIMR